MADHDKIIGQAREVQGMGEALSGGAPTGVFLLCKELADALEAATKRRTVATVEEFVIVGDISGKHISVPKADAERIAARGDREVLSRAATEWEPFTPTPEGSES